MEGRTRHAPSSIYGQQAVAVLAKRSCLLSQTPSFAQSPFARGPKSGQIRAVRHLGIPYSGAKLPDKKTLNTSSTSSTANASATRRARGGTIGKGPGPTSDRRKPGLHPNAASISKGRGTSIVLLHGNFANLDRRGRTRKAAGCHGKSRNRAQLPYWSRPSACPRCRDSKQRQFSGAGRVRKYLSESDRQAHPASWRPTVQRGRISSQAPVNRRGL